MMDGTMPGVSDTPPAGGPLAELRTLLERMKLNVPVTENPNPGDPANEIQIQVLETRHEGYTLVAGKTIHQVEAVCYRSGVRRDTEVADLAAAVSTALRQMSGYRRNSIVERWEPTDGAVRSVNITAEVVYLRHYPSGGS